MSTRSGSAKAAAIAQIETLAKECSEPDWDGENARPLDRLAALSATNFIRALPDGIALPELAPEPDGSICLEWIQSRNCLFSLSVGANGRLAYAWMDGTDGGHAAARFDGETIPPEVLEGIKRVAREGC